MTITPVARQLFLCDHYIRFEDSKSDLHGIFNRMTAEGPFPYACAPFYLFAQLTNGLGRMSIHAQIRVAETDELVFTTQPKSVVFSDRLIVFQTVFAIDELICPAAGVFLFELFCNNEWLCDTSLEIDRA